MNDKLIILKSRSDGYGLFASKNIKKGENVFVFANKKIKINHKPGCHCEICCRCIQVGKYIWLYPEKKSFGWYLNHSCSPNCGIKDYKIVSLKEIKKGDEISIDYSTTNDDCQWKMRCKCNSRECRKVIKSIQFLPCRIYKNYKGFVPDYIANVKDIQMKKDTFSEKCYFLLRKVPRGMVTTYKEIANALDTYAYRAVGSAMRKNPKAPRVPCHRVVCSDGRIGEYAFGKKKKIELLKKEGIKLENGKIRDFERVLFKF